MKTNLLVLGLLILMNFTMNAQDMDYDKKTGIVTAGGVEQFKMEEIKSPTFYGMDDIFIKNTAGKELMFLKMDEYNDPQRVSSSNTNGREIYIQINFLNDATTAEVNYYVRNKKIAELIYDAKLIVNGEIDPEAQKKFIMVHGNRFTKRRNEISNNNKVIIIDNSNNQPAAPRNGLNINISR